MKIIVTGASGQLGKDLVSILMKSGHEVLGYSRQELDITNQYLCESIICSQRPDAIIHCAAYTAVDMAETDADQAYLVNGVGSRNIAVAAEKVNAKVCYISTDYVFDGNSSMAYNEYDNTNPQSIYGKSKRAGEYLVQTFSSRYFIVRTSWVYGCHGNNFVKTMMKLGTEKSSLKVVNDQIGSPTYTVDLAHFLEGLIKTEYYGIFHASNTGFCSWFEFAQAIFEELKWDIELIPCTTSEFPRPAPRPKYSMMDHMAIRTSGLNDLRHWKEALREFIIQNKNNF
ncbi:dTDP-4-dehydrorhamnose reductase [Paenibacillus sp. NAIST15-1]|uniref:dTDP-4-dehydrorhamnose reductase n=1 Tax=Paenibacillus sp. NAIST15-1 TaxID=1605994 RepID=UPI00086935F4|nr:dTDP-4-dehydrorhamnose reductase [Paenibacillus sp. NAIST15-1]GAV12370.1 spore coat polysaccharide biosynthesis protein spsK [Paenibacillus sp. NAIST15-1]